MDLKDFGKFVVMIVVVGMIIGIGVLLLDTTRISSSPTVDGNESLATVNATATAFVTEYVQSVTFVGNGTSDCTNASTFSTFDKETVYITITDSISCNASNTYDIEMTHRDLDDEPAVAFAFGRDEVGGIADNWLNLIITIVVMSIIITLVIRSFSPRR